MNTSVSTDTKQKTVVDTPQPDLFHWWPIIERNNTAEHQSKLQILRNFNEKKRHSSETPSEDPKMDQGNILLIYLHMPKSASDIHAPKKELENDSN